MSNLMQLIVVDELTCDHDMQWHTSEDMGVARVRQVAPAVQHTLHGAETASRFHCCHDFTEKVLSILQHILRF